MLSRSAPLRRRRRSDDAFDLGETIYTPSYDRLRRGYFASLFRHLALSQESVPDNVVGNCFFIFQKKPFHAESESESESASKERPQLQAPVDAESDEDGEQGSDSGNEDEEDEELPKEEPPPVSRFHSLATAIDPEFDHLLFFHPASVDVHLRQRLVGHVEAFLMESERYAPSQEPVHCIRFRHVNLGIAYLSPLLLLVVGFQKFVPEKLAIHQMRFLVAGVEFFWGCRRSVLNLWNKSTFGGLLAHLGTEFCPFVVNVQKHVLSLFNSVPFMQLPYKNSAVFVRSVQLLERLKRANQRGETVEGDREVPYLAGCVLYNGEVVCNTMHEDILMWVVYKARHLDLFASALRHGVASSEDEEEEGEFSSKLQTPPVARVVSFDPEPQAHEAPPADEMVSMTNDFFAEFFRPVVVQRRRSDIVDVGATDLDDWVAVDRVSSGAVKKFHSLLGDARIHGQIVYKQEELTDVSLVFIPRNTLDEIRKEAMVSWFFRKRQATRFLQEHGFPPEMCDPNRRGEYVVCLIDRVGLLSVVRLYELRLLTGIHDDRTFRCSLMQLRAKIDEVLRDDGADLEEDFKYLQRDDIRVSLKNARETEDDEHVLVYDSLTKTLSGDFSEQDKDFLPKFAQIHEDFHHANVTKVLLSNSKEVVYAKRIFDQEVFYVGARTRSGRVVPGSVPFPQLDDVETYVKEKVRREYKINLL